MGLVVQSARLRTISILPIARMFCDLATCGGLMSSNGTSDCLRQVVRAVGEIYAILRRICLICFHIDTMHAVYFSCQLSNTFVCPMSVCYAWSYAGCTPIMFLS